MRYGAVLLQQTTHVMIAVLFLSSKEEGSIRDLVSERIWITQALGIHVRCCRCVREFSFCVANSTSDLMCPQHWKKSRSCKPRRQKLLASKLNSVCDILRSTCNFYFDCLLGSRMSCNDHRRVSELGFTSHPGWCLHGSFHSFQDNSGYDVVWARPFSSTYFHINYSPVLLQFDKHSPNYWACPLVNHN